MGRSDSLMRLASAAIVALAAPSVAVVHGGRVRASPVIVCAPSSVLLPVTVCGGTVPLHLGCAVRAPRESHTRNDRRLRVGHCQIEKGTFMFESHASFPR